MNIPEEYRFIIQLGRALHRYGIPSYRIQEFLKEVATEQKISGDFMDTPTWVNYVFYDEDDYSQNYNYIKNMSPGELNLGALAESVDITNSFLKGNDSVSEARAKLTALEKNDFSCSSVLLIACFGISSFTFALMMQSTWFSSFFALFVGIIIGLLATMAVKFSYLKSALEPIAALVATLLNGIGFYFFPEIDLAMNIIASIILFVPGLSLTTAIEEITSKSLVSGTAKLFDALVSLFKQFFGVMLGISLLLYFIELPENIIGQQTPSWVSWLAIPLFLLSLLPVFYVRKKEFLPALFIGCLSFSIMISLQSLGLMMSSFIGAIAVIMISKLLKKVTGSPNLVFSTIGIIMLVPGSKAFLGLSRAFEISSTAESASKVGIQVVYILMGVIGGLIFSGVFNHKH